MKRTFLEFIYKIEKRTRKSGFQRHAGVKTLIGNPKTVMPMTGVRSIDKKRYEDPLSKF